MCPTQVGESPRVGLAGGLLALWHVETSRQQEAREEMLRAGAGHCQFVRPSFLALGVGHSGLPPRLMPGPLSLRPWGGDLAVPQSLPMLVL